MKNNVAVVVGASVGGVVGCLAFFWIVKQGFYGLILPGAFVGLGASIFRSNRKIIPIVCGLIAILAGLFAEWRFAPFVKDESLEYFLSHIHDLRPLTLIMIALGGGLGFWLPFSRGPGL